MKERRHSYRFYGIIIATCVGVLFVLTAGAMHRGEELARLQKGIAREVLRFHVLANSDSDEDQELKMQVKSEVVQYLDQMLGPDASLVATKKMVRDHLEEIEGLACKVIQEEGYDYAVDAVLTQDYFPEKRYGDCCLPKGRYETLQIKIGKAKGQNWWCVLYPSLCFVDESYAVVSQEKMEDMRRILTVEEYELITKDAKVKFGLKWFAPGSWDLNF